MRGGHGPPRCALPAMTRRVQVLHRTRDDRLLFTARWCDTFASRLVGLMFRRNCPPGQGLVLVQRRASRWDAAIHMWFVAFPLGVLWLDDEGVVNGVVRARPWRFYLPPEPARYVVESTPDLLECVRPGDRIAFHDV